MIDFLLEIDWGYWLHRFFFGEEIPGMVYAIDPIVGAALITTGGALLSGIFGSSSNKKAAEIQGAATLEQIAYQRELDRQNAENLARSQQQLYNLDPQNHYANLEAANYQAQNYDFVSQNALDLGDPALASIAQLDKAQSYQAQGYDAQGYTATLAGPAQGYDVSQLSAPEFRQSANLGEDTGLRNEYANLRVGTYADEVQQRESEQALATALDTATQAGTGAGGATALARQAIASKAGSAANIQQQELQNERLRAQGAAEISRANLSQRNLSRQADLAQSNVANQARFQANQFNAGAANQQAQFLAGAQNQINLTNTAAQNQAAQFGASAANQAAAFGASAANQAAQFGAQAVNQFALTDFNARNQNNQFNAAVTNQFTQAQFQHDAAVNAANAQAANNAAQFNASANNAASQYNATGQWNADVMAAQGEQAIEDFNINRELAILGSGGLQEGVNPNGTSTGYDFNADPYGITESLQDNPLYQEYVQQTAGNNGQGVWMGVDPAQYEHLGDDFLNEQVFDPTSRLYD